MISYLGESPGGIFAAIARFVCIAHFTAEWYSFSLLWACFLSVFFFLYTRLSSAFDFSMSKDFSIKEHPYLYLKLRK